MKPILKSNKLDNVLYDIRGETLEHAKRLEDEGHRVIKLNIGNPAPFDLMAPEEIIQDVIHHLPESEGYCDSKGLYSARKAVMQYYQGKGVRNVHVDDIILGNGVSELIVMAMQALLNNGDELLIPAPDYPLWTAAVSLSSGTPVHYRCDEQSDWIPDIDDIKSKINSKTRGIVIINPNNPTGANYPTDFLEQVIELARQHQLIIFADEIYDKILYDNEVHTPMSSLADDLVIVTLNGLSKSYRVAGLRSGWMLVSGNKRAAKDFFAGLNILASMRLCANVPAQHAIQTALGGYQTINDLVLPTGRLGQQRDVAWEMLNSIEGISCIKPKGALYLFPKMDQKVFAIENDEKLIRDILLEEKVLLVQGTAFNWPEPDHFRIVFLPRSEDLIYAIEKVAGFFDRLRKKK